MPHAQSIAKNVNGLGTDLQKYRQRNRLAERLRKASMSIRQHESIWICSKAGNADLLYLLALARTNICVRQLNVKRFGRCSGQGSYNDIGHEAEDEEGDMSAAAPSRIDDLQNCVCSGCLPLDLDGQQAKQHNLDCGSSSIPAWKS